MSLFKNMFLKDRYEVDKYIIAEIEVLIKFLKIFSNEKISKSQINNIIELENIFENKYKIILEALKKSKSLPFYWQELYDIITQLRNIFLNLNNFYNKFIILKPKKKFKEFFLTELTIIENLKTFFQEYLHNYKYVSELIKNNSYEIKNFYKQYLNLEKGIKFNSFNSIKIFDILLIFENINKSNEKTQGLLNKILIMINV